MNYNDISLEGDLTPSTSLLACIIELNLTIFFSSLCCKDDKTNWAFHMYKIYQQYEDNLLRRVLQHLRKSKMISLNKRSKKVGAQEDKIPLNANPYQLSVTFLHKFLSRYQPDVYIRYVLLYYLIY